MGGRRRSKRRRRSRRRRKSRKRKRKENRRHRHLHADLPFSNTPPKECPFMVAGKQKGGRGELSFTTARGGNGEKKALRTLF